MHFETENFINNHNLALILVLFECCKKTEEHEGTQHLQLMFLVVAFSLCHMKMQCTAYYLQKTRVGIAISSIVGIISVRYAARTTSISSDVSEPWYDTTTVSVRDVSFTSQPSRPCWYRRSQLPEFWTGTYDNINHVQSNSVRCVQPRATVLHCIYNMLLERAFTN